MEKAAQGPTDALFLDLEDAVIPSLKPKARQEAIAALNQLDWGRRGVAVRVNGFGTAWGCRDIIEIVEACPRLDYILLPKCESRRRRACGRIMIAPRRPPRHASAKSASWA